MLAVRPRARPTAAPLAGGPAGTAVHRPKVGRRERLVVGAVAVAVAALAAAAAVPLLPTPGSGARTDGKAAGEATAPCVPLPYQPCGAAPAPGTDGERCVDDRADYDGEAANGCEAVPDGVDGTPLGAVEATVVPAGDVDEYPVEVADHFHFACDGTVTFDLTAPPGMALRLEVRHDDGTLLGESTSADGVTSRLRLREPQCMGDDAATLTARVAPVGPDRSGEAYRLERTGSW
jgi:hypothetical protein